MNSLYRSFNITHIRYNKFQISYQYQQIQTIIHKEEGRNHHDSCLASLVPVLFARHTL